MNTNNFEIPLSSGKILLYQTEDGRLKLEVRLENETLWLTQQHMAELFQTSKQNIGQHLKNIFEEGELDQDAVVKNFFTTAADGKNYDTRFNEREVLPNAGSVGKKEAEGHARQEYERFAERRREYKEALGGGGAGTTAHGRARTGKD